MDPQTQAFLDQLNKHPDILGDADNISAVKELEVALNEARANREYGQNEITKKRVLLFKERILGINKQLMSDRKMTDIDRALLFKEKDLLAYFIEMNDWEVQATEETNIKNKIHEKRDVFCGAE